MAEADRETRSPEGTAAEEEGEQGRNGGEEQNGGAGVGDTIVQELKQAVRDAALEVLGPAARQATTSAAKYAVSKGPELVKDNVMPAVNKAGGAGGLAQQAMSKGGEALSGSGGVSGMAGKLMSKLGGGGGGGEASGWGRNRRMPVQQTMYVSVPVKQAYNGWTEYKQWPRYMHRANQVDAEIDERQARVKITEKMWGFKRPFTAEIVSQRPDEHIKWNATEGTKHTGVINFHELGPRLTLIEVNLDHSPSGVVEKFARGTRFVKRAVRADFHRFRGWIEMKSEDELDELEGWRGTIEDGQIVTSHEDALEEEEREDDQESPEDRESSEDDQGSEGEHDEGPQAAEDEESADEEPEDEGEEEPQAAEDDESEAEYEEEPEAGEDEEPEAGAEDEEPEAEYEDQPEGAEDEEEEAPPRRRRPARQRTPQRRAQSQEPQGGSSRGQPRRRQPSEGGRKPQRASQAAQPRQRSSRQRSSR